jgi:hypothetical protein
MMDNREKLLDFDITKVDFEWVERTNNKKEMKKAYLAIS